MENTQGVLKLKRTVHIVTNDYCELRRVEHSKTVIAKMVAPAFLCLLGVSRYWCVLTASSAEKQRPSPPLPRTLGGGEDPEVESIQR